MKCSTQFDVSTFGFTSNEPLQFTIIGSQSRRCKMAVQLWHFRSPNSSSNGILRNEVLHFFYLYVKDQVKCIKITSSISNAGLFSIDQPLVLNQFHCLTIYCVSSKRQMLGHLNTNKLVVNMHVYNLL